MCFLVTNENMGLCLYIQRHIEKAFINPKSVFHYLCFEGPKYFHQLLQDFPSNQDSVYLIPESQPSSLNKWQRSKPTVGTQQKDP